MTGVAFNRNPVLPSADLCIYRLRRLVGGCKLPDAYSFGQRAGKRPDISRLKRKKIPQPRSTNQLGFYF